MSIASIPHLKKIISGTIEINDTVFTYTIYPNPHKQPRTLRNELVALFGDQETNRGICLGITNEVVRENIAKKMYSAMIKVINPKTGDAAIATLQLWDWLSLGTKQLWVHDLCRLKKVNSKSVSPVLALFMIVEHFSKKYGITENYLFVEKTEPEKNILPKIYAAYGFSLMNNTAPEETELLVMKRVISTN